MVSTTRDNEVLLEEECWSLLGATGLGRLATAAKGTVDIFPVNYLVHDRALLFRSAPGSKLAQITAAPLVAFEADGVDGRWPWSVIVHGRAQRLNDEDDIYESGVLELASWSATEKFNFVRIIPTDVTGRRVDRSSPPPAHLAG